MAGGAVEPWLGVRRRAPRKIRGPSASLGMTQRSRDDQKIRDDTRLRNQKKRPREIGLLWARFQVHSALFAPVAEAEAMPCGRSHPVAMQNAQRDDRDARVAEPFVGRLEHRLH